MILTPRSRELSLLLFPFERKAQKSEVFVVLEQGQSGRHNTVGIHPDSQDHQIFGGILKLFLRQRDPLPDRRIPDLLIMERFEGNPRPPFNGGQQGLKHRMQLLKKNNHEHVPYLPCAGFILHKPRRLLYFRNAKKYMREMAPGAADFVTGLLIARRLGE